MPRFFPLIPLGHTWLLVPLPHLERRVWSARSPLVSTAANEHWISLPGARTGAALCPSYSTPSTQTTGTAYWGHHRATVTPSCPWLALIPGLFPFSVSPKASRGFQALELCSAKVLLRAGNVWVLNECSKVSTGSWGWV